MRYMKNVAVGEAAAKAMPEGSDSRRLDNTCPESRVTIPFLKRV